MTLKLLPTSSRSLDDLPAGSLHWDAAEKLLCVRCKSGWIGISELHLVGKRKSTAEAFVNGYYLRKPGHGALFEWLDRDSNTGS